MGNYAETVYLLGKLGEETLTLNKSWGGEGT